MADNVCVFNGCGEASLAYYKGSCLCKRHYCLLMSLDLLGRGSSLSILWLSEYLHLSEDIDTWTTYSLVGGDPFA